MLLFQDDVEANEDVLMLHTDTLVALNNDGVLNHELMKSIGMVCQPPSLTVDLRTTFQMLIGLSFVVTMQDHADK